MTTPRICVTTATLVALAACSVPNQVEQSALGARPNILLIVSEDNGPEIGAYGAPHVLTPNLDALAASGVLFQNAYVPQAGCSQSRAAFLTGLYPHQNGQIGLATWKFGLYRSDTPNIVRSLKQAGYRTGIIGKLHINPAEAFPFEFVKIPSANFQREAMGRYAAFAAEFMGQSEQPFFLSVNYPDAHRPFLSQVDGIPERPLQAADVEPLEYMGLDSPELREQTANYYNSMNRLDTYVGDLLQTLIDSGKHENTLVVYLGDHGADLLRGKRTSYEGGVRVPLIVRWPGLQQAGQVRKELVSTLDLMPTFLEASAGEEVAGLAGRSLSPLLAGGTPPWREYLFTEFHLHSNHNYFPQRTVRDQQYKLIRNLMPNTVNPGHAFTLGRFFNEAELHEASSRAPQQVRMAYHAMGKPPEFELYDLAVDPHEFSNLASNPAHDDTLERLKARLQQWRVETEDPFLDPANTARLKADIEGTRENGEYVRPAGWSYTEYLAPSNPASAASRRAPLVEP